MIQEMKPVEIKARKKGEVGQGKTWSKVIGYVTELVTI